MHLGAPYGVLVERVEADGHDHGEDAPALRAGSGGDRERRDDDGGRRRERRGRLRRRFGRGGQRGVVGGELDRGPAEVDAGFDALDPRRVVDGDVGRGDAELHDSCEPDLLSNPPGHSRDRTTTETKTKTNFLRASSEARDDFPAHAEGEGRLGPGLGADDAGSGCAAVGFGFDRLCHGILLFRVYFDVREKWKTRLGRNDAREADVH